jgi:hypothetical protein
MENTTLRTTACILGCVAHPDQYRCLQTLINFATNLQIFISCPQISFAHHMTCAVYLGTLLYSGTLCKRVGTRCCFHLPEAAGSIGMPVSTYQTTCCHKPVDQASATYGTRAKCSTRNDFQWHTE